MQLREVVAEALVTLWRRRWRTLLSVIGVAAGCFVLTTSLAVGQGVQTAIAAHLRRQDLMRQITVWTGGSQPSDEPIVVEGDMSEARRARLADAIKLRREKVYAAPGRGITPEQQAAIAALPGVQEVAPALSWVGRVFDRGKEVRGTVSVAGGREESLTRRVLVGAVPIDGGLMVSEFVAYSWGVEEAELVGRDVTVELESAPRGFHTLLQLLNVARPDLSADQRRVLDKVTARVPQMLADLDLPADEKKVLAELLIAAKPGEGPPKARVTLPIRGVFRDTTRGELTPWDSGLRPVDVYVPPDVARRLHLMQGGRANSDLPAVSVLVADEDGLRAVQKSIERMGLETFSMSELVDNVKFNVRVIVAVLTLLAVVALIVAALGIANTMTMAVLQRTHEIGVLKALGARDGQVLGLFLTEGLAVGTAGGLLGAAAAWLASFPGDAFARWLIRAQTPMVLEESVFAFPLWLTAGSPLLAVVLTAAAAYVPARRAARIDPVAALRERS